MWQNHKFSSSRPIIRTNLSPQLVQTIEVLLQSHVSHRLILAFDTLSLLDLKHYIKVSRCKTNLVTLYKVPDWILRLGIKDKVRWNISYAVLYMITLIILLVYLIPPFLSVPMRTVVCITNKQSWKISMVEKTSVTRTLLKKGQRTAQIELKSSSYIPCILSLQPRMKIHGNQILVFSLRRCQKKTTSHLSYFPKITPTACGRFRTACKTSREI